MRSERDDVMAVLREHLLAVCPEAPADLPGDVSLADDLRMDSLDIVEFVARVEEHYRVSVPDSEWDRLATLDDISAFVVAGTT